MSIALSLVCTDLFALEYRYTFTRCLAYQYLNGYTMFVAKLYLYICRDCVAQNTCKFLHIVWYINTSTVVETVQRSNNILMLHCVEGRNTCMVISVFIRTITIWFYEVISKIIPVGLHKLWIIAQPIWFRYYVLQQDVNFLTVCVE